MSILWWLAAPALATALAMVWASWAGRPRRPMRPDESSDAYDKFTDALRRPLPERARGVVRQQPERLAGVAVRPSSGPTPLSSRDGVPAVHRSQTPAGQAPDERVRGLAP